MFLPNIFCMFYLLTLLSSATLTPLRNNADVKQILQEIYSDRYYPKDSATYGFIDFLYDLYSYQVKHQDETSESYEEIEPDLSNEDYHIPTYDDNYLPIATPIPDIHDFWSNK